MTWWTRRTALASVAGSLALSVMAKPCHAEGDDLSFVLDPPEAPTLPGLTHDGFDVSFQYTGAAIQLNRTTDPTIRLPSGSDAFAYFAHLDAEVPLAPRRWFFGWANDLVSGAVPGAGRAFLLGNPELWARGVWWNESGLASGAGLGVVLPIPRDLDEQQQEVLTTVRGVRLWDAAYFDDLTLTLRPFFDIRHVTGRFSFQLRQGVDWSWDFEESDYFLTARVAFHMGFRASEDVGLGVELWELYQLASDVPDDKRAAFSVSPGIRFLWEPVRPGLSVLLPIATPLLGDVASFIAIRAHLDVSFDLHTGANEASARLGEPFGPR